MSRYIRWWGLIVFVVVVGGAFAGVALWADWLVKRAVESWGTSMNGARVDLDDAQLTFTPFGFVLDNLQVASAKEPMQNALQVARIKLALDGYALLRRKIVITDMNMEGVQTHTPRSVSGAIPNPPPPEPEPEDRDGAFSFPSVDFPSAKDIVESEGLQSGKLAETFRDELDKSKQQWERRLAELPTEAALAEYQNRLKQARPSLDGNALQDAQEIARAVKDLKKIRDDARIDLDRIQSAKRALGDDLNLWSDKTKELLAAPGADLSRLREKYSFDAKGLANISNALFGPQVAEWTRSARHWYARVQPYIAKSERKPEEVERRRLKGVDIKFVDRHQVPDFLIRSIKISVDVTAGKMQGEIRNVTTDQPTLGHPLTFSFFGERLNGVQDLEIEGTFNHVLPRASFDQIGLNAHGISIERYQLSGHKSFPLRLENSTLDLETRAELKQSEQLNGTINVAFKTVNLVSDVGSDQGELGQVVANALAEVKQFAAVARLNGTLSNYDVDLRSDLDERLRTALNKQFRERIDRFLADVKAQLDARVQQSMRQIQAKLDELKDFERKVEQRRKQAEEALQKAEAELRAVVDEKKSEAERKRDEAKQQLKSESDEQKQKAKDKAKKEAEKLLKGIK